MTIKNIHFLNLILKKIKLKGPTFDDSFPIKLITAPYPNHVWIRISSQMFKYNRNNRNFTLIVGFKQDCCNIFSLLFLKLFVWFSSKKNFTTAKILIESNPNCYKALTFNQNAFSKSFLFSFQFLNFKFKNQQNNHKESEKELKIQLSNESECSRNRSDDFCNIGFKMDTDY